MKAFQGDWFKQRLRDVGKTQAGLSRYSNIDTATISLMLADKRRLRIEEVEVFAEFLEVSAAEILTRAGLPITANDCSRTVIEVGADNGELDIVDEETAWALPAYYIKSALRAEAPNLRIVEAVSDSMAPTIKAGDKVVIDISKTQPSPAGVFALNDGVAVVLNRINYIIQSDPPALRITSDSSEGDGTAVLADGVNILGRVIAVIQKL